MVLKSCFPELPSGGCWPRDDGAEHRGCFPGHERRPVGQDRAPSNKRLHATGGYALKEAAVVRLRRTALRANGGAAR